MKTRKILFYTFLILIIPLYVWAGSWSRDGKHIYPFYAGPTGGAAGDLDSLTGASMMAYDRALVFDTSGVTVSFYVVVNTGSTVAASASGTTMVCPDDLESGGTLSGTSTWQRVAISGTTLEATNTLILDGYTLVKAHAGYLTGFTSDPQTQIDTKASTTYVDNSISAVSTYVDNQITGVTNHVDQVASGLSKMVTDLQRRLDIMPTEITLIYVTA